MLADPVERRFLHRQFATERARPAESTSERDDETGLTASGFRTLVADHEHQELEHRQEHRRAAAEQRRRKVAELIDRHISDKSWRGLVHEARQTAEAGEGSSGAPVPKPAVQ